jgi:hypothetical protein
MSEFEILDLMTKTEDQRFNLIQWWAGVTFGLIALSHFAGRKLNLFLVVLVVLLYVGFTLFVGDLFFGNVTQAALHREDLAAMQALGAPLSEVSRQIVAEDPQLLRGIGFYFAVIGAFFGSISYLVYAFARSGGDDQR